MMDDELEFGETACATADEAGVYCFIRAFWTEADVGHLFYVPEGGLRACGLTGNPNGGFDWNPELVREGYLVKVPQSDQLMNYIRERDHMQQQLDMMLRSLGPHGPVSDGFPR